MNNYVLVIDDNYINLKLVCDILIFEGYTVATAGNATEALKKISADPPDIILMDIQLPEMDGLTLTKKIKANPATKHIPIIALTSFAMKGDEEKALAAGCDGYITKPIDTRTLPEIVKRQLKKQA